MAIMFQTSFHNVFRWVTEKNKISKAWIEILEDRLTRYKRRCMESEDKNERQTNENV